MNILVVTSEEYLTLQLLKCLAPLDAVVHVIACGPAPAVRASRYCRRYTEHERSALASADLDRYCRRHAIDIVLPSGMACGFLLASWKESFQAAPMLPMPPVELLRMLNNKWFFSRFLEQHGLPFPKSRLIQGDKDVKALDLEFPVIIKPLELDASRGVERCDAPAKVQAYLSRAEAVLPLLVQEYIPGDDVGLGLLARQGTVLAWTIQKQLPDGSGIEFIRHEQVLDIGRRIVAACQYDGIMHFDMRLDARDGSVKVLECNPRFWASLPFSMVTGVNFPDMGIRLALEQPLPEMSYQPVRITFPTRVLAGALRGGAACWPLSEPSWQALRFTLSDPLPQLFLGADRLQRKAAAVFCRTEKAVIENHP